MNIENYKNKFEKIYGTDPRVLNEHVQRYYNLDACFLKHFNEQAKAFFSTPGRTEIGGNHTDHNHGRVLAASINLDSIAGASKSYNNKIILHSEGYADPFEVDLKNLAVVEKEKGSTSALVRGIAARFKELGANIGGLNICMSSDVLRGSGLSSSASVEVLIGTILNSIYNEDKFSAEELAIIGQYAENIYFGKPCGLMDQMACAVGGIISIDFKDPENPLVKQISFDFDSQEYSLLVVDTGSSHVDLTNDYASIPTDMKKVAKILNREVLRGISVDAYMEQIHIIRKQLGDLAVLRGLHFLYENKRVTAQVAALDSGDFKKFLKLVNDSGNSSIKWLQNIYSPSNVREQGMTLGLALAEKYIAEIGEGACRVHGGGFAGTIQVFLPKAAVDGYKQLIEPLYGAKSVVELKIRRKGSVQII